MLYKIYLDRPDPAHLAPIVKILRDGGIIIYPTDTVYSIGCDALNNRALERLARLKGIDPKKSTFSILCSDISQAANYARLNNNDLYKLIKNNTPGPFTFILPTGSALPKIYKGRKEVGIRIPDDTFVKALLHELGSPLTGFSLPIGAEDAEDPAYRYNPELIHDQWSNLVEMVIDGGERPGQPSCVVDCTDPEEMVIVREGPKPLEY